MLAAVLGLLAFDGLAAYTPAQELQFPQRPPPPRKSQIQLEREKSGQKQMLVRADEVAYDYTNYRVAAVGNVQIYYRGSTLEANRVVYDQKTKRLHAEGNVRLTDQDGKVTYGEIMDLSDDYRDGFVDSLRLDAPDQTRMAATRAERSAAISQCSITASIRLARRARTIRETASLAGQGCTHHSRSDRENDVLRGCADRIFWSAARVAALLLSTGSDGQAQDRLSHTAIGASSVYGGAAEIPYYWALAPDYDATFAPMITTKQGPLLQASFRQRLINGAYSIRAAGIYQLDKDYFIRSDGSTTPGYRDFRGSLGKLWACSRSTTNGCGLGRCAAVRQNVLPGLQPAPVEIPDN